MASAAATGVGQVPSRSSAAASSRPAPSFEINSSTLAGDVTISDITFDGGRPTDAFFVSPKTAARGTSPGIVWFHWYETSSSTSNRSEFLEEAKALAQRGFVSVLVDGAFPWNQEPSSRDHDVEAVEAELAMLGAARDLLAAQAAVDPTRVALVGHDFGAMYSATLFGEDQSLAALVVMAPTARWSDWFQRYWQISGDATAYRSAMTPLDPITGLTRAADRPVLLQFGTHDRFVPAATADELTAAAGSGAERLNYDAGHELNDAATADRDAWLVEQLGGAPR